MLPKWVWFLLQMASNQRPQEGKVVEQHSGQGFGLQLLIYIYTVFLSAQNIAILWGSRVFSVGSSGPLDPEFCRSFKMSVLFCFDCTVYTRGQQHSLSCIPKPSMLDGQTEKNPLTTK